MTKVTGPFSFLDRFLDAAGLPAELLDEQEGRAGHAQSSALSFTTACNDFEL
jgi:hypothetical protein